MRRPSGDHAADQTPSPWPERTASCLAVSASQMRAVWSKDAVTMRRPSGENAADHTISAWPESTSSGLAVSASQIRAVWSAEAVTMRRPSGENAAVRTGVVMARKYGELSARGRVPDARGLVVGGGDDAPPVGRERGAAHVSALVVGGKALAMAGEDRELHAAGRIPDTRRAVIGGGDDAPPVGRERNAADDIVMAGESGDLLERGRVPDAGELVAGVGGRRDDNALPVGRIRGVGNVVAKIGQHGELHAAGDVPDLRRVVQGGGDDAPPVGRERGDADRLRDGRKARRAAWPCPRPRCARSCLRRR